MARARTIACALACGIIWLAGAHSSAASDDDFKVIVHRDNRVDGVDKDFLRDVFLKKTRQWEHGAIARPIDLAKSLAVRDRFTLEVLGRSPAQLRSYWCQRIFSGTDIPPPEAESPAAAIAYVMANPGAIAYIPINADPGGARVIRIR